ncbi:MAG: dicarboxylate/amino acid:cation symporter [Verrucomicrobia bacterium]|nr:dicarboxylate/amino acid:cation symporter [Verrucomicrobiota bacterium]
MKNFFKSRSAQIFLVLALYFAASGMLPDEIPRGLYAASLTIKNLLLWMLPVTVGLFIAHAIASFEKRAPFFILTLFCFEAASNFLSVWYSYGCGQMAAHSLGTFSSGQIVDNFAPLWRLGWERPAWWSAEKGTFAGIGLGLIGAFGARGVGQAVRRGKEITEKILTNFFSKLIPLFVLGFVAKMGKTELLGQMFVQYADFLVWLAVILASYIGMIFLVGSGFSMREFIRSVKNLLPAGGIAFSSGCSLSTMPWTIEGSGKNLQNPELAKAVIPATTNIQQIGDCIANSFLCFLIYLHFNGESPPLAVWIPFSLVFVLARFATAAVLGGAIFIMLPIYESYLGFSSEMIAIILAFNVILDPLITCANVVANGGLCRVFERVWRAVSWNYMRS